MDPVTAFLNCVTAIATMVSELSKGMTPEQKQALWARYIQDTDVIRKVLKIDN